MPTILIIEDNRTLRENISEFLEIEGYAVVTAKNGKDGFEKAFQIMPDIIVCDLLMPEMGGLELLTKLGSHNTLKNIPLIIYSAKSEKKDILRSKLLGAYDYIIKPSDLEDLLRSIQKYFKSKEIRFS